MLVLLAQRQKIAYFILSIIIGHGKASFEFNSYSRWHLAQGELLPHTISNVSYSLHCFLPLQNISNCGYLFKVLAIKNDIVVYS